MTTPMPLARTAELIIQEVDQECLVYDLSRNKALSLNELSTLIWKYCDGSTSVANVASIIELKAKTKIDEDFIWLAISDLQKNNLLAGEVNRPTEFDNLSRRKVLLKYALSAITIPAIFSIVAPTSAQTGTGGTPTQPMCPIIPPGCNGVVPGGIPVGCPCSLNCSNCVGGQNACDTSIGFCV